MKTRYIGSFLRVALAALLLPAGVQAGNPDRAGQAGASELLINPWARSNGWGGANSGSIRGLEAQFLNVAGTAFTKKTEAIFAHTMYLEGSGMALNAFGITQKAGEAGVIGLSVVSFDFGDIPVTTTEQPEGNIGNYRPAVYQHRAFVCKGILQLDLRWLQPEDHQREHRQRQRKRSRS
ncbi:MAG: hypothetical protein ACOJUL_01600 [Candidatus Pollutiaquabacter aromativorans]